MSFNTKNYPMKRGQVNLFIFYYWKQDITIDSHEINLKNRILIKTIFEEIILKTITLPPVLLQMKGLGKHENLSFKFPFRWDEETWFTYAETMMYNLYN